LTAPKHLELASRDISRHRQHAAVRARIQALGRHVLLRGGAVSVDIAGRRTREIHVDVGFKHAIVVRILSLRQLLAG